MPWKKECNTHIVQNKSMTFFRNCTKIFGIGVEFDIDLPESADDDKIRTYSEPRPGDTLAGD